MTSDRLDPAVIAEWTRNSRAKQALSAQIMDPAVLVQVITLAFAGTGPHTRDSAPGSGNSRRRGENTSGPAVGHRTAQPSAAKR
jgi:hypothetical protein